VKVWTVCNWKWIVLIMWFTLNGRMNCIQLEMDCSDHIVIYLEWKYELYTTRNGLFWSYCDLSWMEVWTVYNEQSISSCIQFILSLKVNHMIRTIHYQLYTVHTSIQGKSQYDQNNPLIVVYSSYFHYNFIKVFQLCFKKNIVKIIEVWTL
jgi:hypothetical protein